MEYDKVSLAGADSLTTSKEEMETADAVAGEDSLITSKEEMETDDAVTGTGSSHPTQEKYHLQLPIEESNVLRFCYLILKVAPEAVRHRFDQVFPPHDLASIIQGSEKILRDLKSRRIISDKQFNIIFALGSAPESRSFDVTLMLCLFRHLTNISPRSGIYDSLPPPSDVTLGDDLARIKYYRNKIANYSRKDRRIDNKEFLTVWETVSKAVGRIGGADYEQQCTTLLTTSLDSGNLNIYRQFMDLLSKQQDQMEILESKQVKLETTLRDIVSRIKRGSALPTPEEGMYDNDGDTLTDSHVKFKQTDTIFSYPVELPVDETNFLRVCYLIQIVAPEAVRYRFDQTFPPNNLDSIIRRNKSILEKCRYWRVITNEQFGFLFPHGSVPVSSNFDVTLMLCLFRYLTDISPRSGDFASLPPPSDVTLGADLARIKYYTNKISHFIEKDRELVKQDFRMDDVWDDVTKAVGRIGGSYYEQQCTKLLTTSLDSSYPDIYREFVELLSIQGEQMENLESKRVELETKLRALVSPKYRDICSGTMLKCDDFHVHLLVDTETCQRIQAAYKNLHETPTLKTRQDAVSILIFLQTELVIDSVTKDTLTEILKWTIRRNEGVICRYILTKSGIFDKEIELIRTIFDGAIEQKAEDCAKAVAWYIVRLFVKTYKHMLASCIDIWPGLRCRCPKTEYYDDKCNFYFCSSELILVTEHVDHKMSFPTCFRNFEVKVLLKSELEHSREGEHTSEIVIDVNANGLDSKFAKELFDRHSNLCVISPANVKSTGFPVNHCLRESNCIQLFCKAKGVIPIGEPHFPSEKEGRNTDILNGSSYLLTRAIKIGDEVGSESSCGTLGGFVKILGDETFLTCAHVVLGKSIMSTFKTKQKMKEAIEIGIKDHSTGNYFKCGKVRNLVFQEGNSKETSIDAALVAFDPRHVCIDPNGILTVGTGSDMGMTSLDLNECFIDEREIGTNQQVYTLAVGSMSGYNKTNENVQMEDENHLEFETLRQVYESVRQSNPKPGHLTQDVHIRTTIDEVGTRELSSRRACTFYKQISFKHIKFQPGDSGTCIYVRKQNDNRYRCIGMAIATHPSGTGGCIVTPMKAILSAFGLQ